MPEADANVEDDHVELVVGGDEVQIREGDDGGWAVENPYTTIAVPDVGLDEDGERCEQTRWIAVLPENVEAAEELWERAFWFDTEFLLPDEVPLPECPTDPPPIDEDRILDVVQRVILEEIPRPEPRMQPDGEAITGKQAYLQTNRDLHIGSEAEPIADSITIGGTDFDVHLWADATYMVDWGQQDDPAPDDDPAHFDRVSGPHTVPGAPWDPDDPFGSDKVFHFYTHVPESGEATITVVDTWTIHYRVVDPVTGASIGSTLTAQLAPRSTVLPLTQVQAVITDQ